MPVRKANDMDEPDDVASPGAMSRAAFTCVGP